MTVDLRSTVVAAAIVLAVVGVLVQSDDRSHSSSTFGTGAVGFKAFFDLLAELDVPVARSFEAADRLPSGGTVWWTDAGTFSFAGGGGPCAAEPKDDEVSPAWPGELWVDGGGTAVVLLGPGYEGCHTLAGFLLPCRVSIDPEGNVIDKKKRRTVREIGVFDVSGPVTDRRLRTTTLLVFADTGEWEAGATVEGHPFLLERQVGDGRLIVVADGRFARNSRLGVGDAANLAVDLVRSYGVPLFDEYAHGFRPQQNVVYYLFSSPAAGVLVGLSLFGLLVTWRGSLVPGPPMPQDSLPAPALDSYVNSMAAWYARTSDYSHVLERYRQYAVSRLQRHLGVAPQTPLQALAERLQGSPRVSGDLIEALLHPPVPTTRKQLRAATATLDTLIQEVTR